MFEWCLYSGYLYRCSLQGWRNLVAGYGSCHTNICDIGITNNNLESLSLVLTSCRVQSRKVQISTSFKNMIWKFCLRNNLLENWFTSCSFHSIYWFSNIYDEIRENNTATWVFLEIRIQRVISVYSLHPANKSAIKKGSSFTMFQKYDKEILQVLFLPRP